MRKSILLILYILFNITFCFSNDSTYLKVHFLYGSKPKKEFKHIEMKWFGGKLGGHVGLQVGDGHVYSFLPKLKFHVFGKKKEKHSQFIETTESGFWTVLGFIEDDEVKKASFHIPISKTQKEKLDSIHIQYIQETPYDYALFGMRCGAATYDILAQLGFFKQYSITKTSRKIFYPRRLRKRLFKMAKTNNWKIETQKGIDSRKWEKDL